MSDDFRHEGFSFLWDYLVMANQPKTPLIAFRLPQGEQDELKTIAAAEGVTVTDLMREAVRALIASRRGV